MTQNGFVRVTEPAQTLKIRSDRSIKVEVKKNILAFVKFCEKLDDSYPLPEEFFFSRSERTLRDSKSTVEDTRLKRAVYKGPYIAVK